MKMLFWNMHWGFVSYRVPATDSSSAKYNLTDLSGLKKKKKKQTQQRAGTKTNIKWCWANEQVGKDNP